MTPTAYSIRVQDLDHCGIVAGIIDQIGLVEQINRELGTHPQEKLSAGVAVKAMILNGLGLVSAPLYLFEKFFVGKATEHLLGEGIQPQHLNDDRLGRVLEQLFEVGLTPLFVKIALLAASKFGVNLDSLHLDSSSFHVHGAYLTKGSSVAEELPAIHITRGYSRDHRPDLKQFIVDLMCSSDGDVLKHLEEKIQQHLDKAQKQLTQLCQQDYACAPDALAAAEQWNKKLRYHHLSQIEVVPHPYYNQPGRPSKGQVPDGYRYRLQGTLTVKEEVVTLARRRAGRFVLATNVLESKSLNEDQMLSEYKEQQSTERGFRFLKDPMFFTSSVFLKTPERIAALAMVMGLCLLVYTLAQRALRQALASAKQTIKNQLGKPTSTPTMRWVFQCFQSIHLVILDGVEQIVNLNQEHQEILRFLGAPYQKYYLLV